MEIIFIGDVERLYVATWTPTKCTPPHANIPSLPLQVKRRRRSAHIPDEYPLTHGAGV